MRWGGVRDEEGANDVDALQPAWDRGWGTRGEISKRGLDGGDPQLRLAQEHPPPTHSTNSRDFPMRRRPYTTANPPSRATTLSSLASSCSRFRKRPNPHGGCVATSCLYV